MLVPSLAVWSLIPWGPGLGVTDLDVGLLFVLALGAFTTLGILTAGWASSNKYSLLGGLRAAAQLISYEVALGLSLVPTFMIVGSLRLRDIVDYTVTWGPYHGPIPLILLTPIGFVIYLISAVAETNRAPFDLPEAEQELTGGFHTEYSGMRFALFFLAEYANMIVVSSVATTLFFGGWLRPFPNVAALSFLDIIPSWTWFLIKSFVFLYIFIWVRATLPRYRYDQLMRLGWKVLIPLAIANLIVTGIVKVLLT